MKNLFVIIHLIFLTVPVFSQNVGIGTMDPQAKLTVEDSSQIELATFKNYAINGRIDVRNNYHAAELGVNIDGGYVGTSGAQDFVIRTNSLNRMMFRQSTGYLGIGTDYPEAKLNVLINHPYESVAVFRNNGGPGNILVSTGTQTLSLGANSTKTFAGSVTATDFALVTDGNNRLFIKNSTGFVGIGTNNPDNLFHVVSSTSNSEIARFQSNGGFGNIFVGNGSAFVEMGHNGSKGFMGTVSPQDLVIRTGSNDRMMFQHSTGNVGIGNNSPQQRLHVSGNALIAGNQTIDGSLGINSTNSLSRFQLYEHTSNPELGFFEGDGGHRNITVSNGIHEAALGTDANLGFVRTSTPSDFAIRTSDSTRIYVQHSTGNVGVGTNAPQYRLDVNGTSRFNGQQIINGNIGIGTASPIMPLCIKADGNADVLQFHNNGGTRKWHWWMPGDNLVLTESTIQDYILTVEKLSGNIGIGKSNPNSKLDVNGDVYIGGPLAVNGPTTLNGVVTLIAIAQPSPSSVTFNVNFSNYGAGYENVSYYKDKEGRVHLSGLVAINGSQSGTIFTLPNDCRPQGQLIFLVMGGSGPSRMDVMTNGDVSISTPVSGWISMNGISFRAN